MIYSFARFFANVNVFACICPKMPCLRLLQFDGNCGILLTIYKAYNNTGTIPVRTCGGEPAERGDEICLYMIPQWLW